MLLEDPVASQRIFFLMRSVSGGALRDQYLHVACGDKTRSTFLYCLRCVPIFSPPEEKNIQRLSDYVSSNFCNLMTRVIVDVQFLRDKI